MQEVLTADLPSKSAQKGLQHPSVAWGVSAGPRAVQEVVTDEVDQRAEQVHCVLCLGHNKGMEEAATSLAVRRPSLSYSSRASPFRSAADWRGKAHLCSAARIAA